MQVFRAALKVFFSHKIYISVYIFALAFMGVAIATGSIGEPREEFSESKPNIAIIDRDRSALSDGLERHLASHANLIEIEDTTLAMQDAVAQDQVSYLVIIPAGFGDEFTQASKTGGEEPHLETMTSYVSVSAALMDNYVNEFLNAVRVLFATDSASSQEEAVSLAASSLENDADATLIQTGESGPISQQYTIYMQFSSYTAMISIIVCSAVMMASFSRTEVRKRNLASSMGPVALNLQILAACLVITLIAWAWVMTLGLLVFGRSLVNVNPLAIGMISLDLLAFCLMALSVGFFIGQLTTNEVVINAAGNISSLVSSFLGGVWIPLEITGEGVQAIARFTPTYYYGEAISHILGAKSYTFESLVPAFESMGVLILFAIAFFTIALVLGRVRTQSAEAGGNAAAERPKA